MAEAKRQRHWIPRDVQGLVTLDPHIQAGIKRAEECKYCNVIYVAPQQLSIDEELRHALAESEHQLPTLEDTSASPISMEETWPGAIVQGTF